MFKMCQRIGAEAPTVQAVSTIFRNVLLNISGNQRLRCFSCTTHRCSSPGSKPRLVLFTKSTGCSLCDDAKEALVPFKHRFEFSEVDILLPENTAWNKKYCFDIPVFHLNDRFLMKHGVNKQLLESSLSQLEKEKS